MKVWGCEAYFLWNTRPSEVQHTSNDQHRLRAERLAETHTERERVLSNGCHSKLRCGSSSRSCSVSRAPGRSSGWPVWSA